MDDGEAMEAPPWVDLYAVLGAHDMPRIDRTGVCASLHVSIWSPCGVPTFLDPVLCYAECPPKVGAKFRRDVRLQYAQARVTGHDLERPSRQLEASSTLHQQSTQILRLPCTLAMCLSSFRSPAPPSLHDSSRAPRAA
jgi:hypothetical protein